MANGKKINGKRQGIPADPNYDTSVEIDEVHSDFVADDKGDLPGSLPSHFDQEKKQPITWFNNFEVKRIDKKNVDKVPSPYKVILQKLPKDKRLCIYIGKLMEITAKQGQLDKVVDYKYVVDKDDDQKIVFYLDVTDPPTGSFP